MISFIMPKSPDELALQEYVRGWLGGPTAQLFTLLSSTAHDTDRALSDYVRRTGLSAPQFTVLVQAALGANIGDIAYELLSDATRVGRLVERMENAGLVRRGRGAPDRRVVWVRLTPAGEAALREGLPGQIARTEEIFQALDDQDRIDLKRILARIRKHLPRNEPSAEGP
jgi:DNA-binding MarR family transcriptional regulator